MKISVIIPAHNEEKYIGNCIDSIHRANKNGLFDVEIVVVLNRCTDATEQIALQKNAKVVYQEEKNLSKIRNTGVRASSGDIVITIDADSVMPENILEEVHRALTAGKYMGGGVKFLPERYSLGIVVTYAFLRLIHFLNGFSGGMFWLFRSDFDKLGGFDEGLVLGEDHDFAMRLKKYARKNRMKYGNLPNGFIITSCRKFDSFGEWHVFQMIFRDFKKIIECVFGKSTEFADHYFYDFN